MGKSRRGVREHTREQKLIQENKRLKRDNATLRKQLARLDLDRYDTIREMIEEHSVQNPDDPSAQDFLDNLKETWACRDCSNGYLEIILFNKLASTFYFRKCNNCDHRTKSQRYDPNRVKGIIKKAIE